MSGVRAQKNPAGILHLAFSNQADLAAPEMGETLVCPAAVPAGWRADTRPQFSEWFEGLGRVTEGRGDQTDKGGWVKLFSVA